LSTVFLKYNIINNTNVKVYMLEGWRRRTRRGGRGGEEEGEEGYIVAF